MDKLERLRQMVEARLIRTSPTSYGGRLMDYDGDIDPDALEAVADFETAVRQDERAAMPCYLERAGPCIPEFQCPSCAARAERDGGTG